MLIKTLVENTTISSQYKAKHGLSLYIETSNHKILFDLGTDSLFLENALKLGVDISEVDTVIISHGHIDHGGGLKKFLEHNKKAKIYIHELAFNDYYVSALGFKINIGLDSDLKSNERIIQTSDNYIIDEELQLFSNIHNNKLNSPANKSLYMKENGKYTKDTFQHEQSLIISDEKKLLVAGCAHCGIINILEKGESICGTDFDYVISGYHLRNLNLKKHDNNELLRAIGDDLKERNTLFYTCHCTGIEPYKILKSNVGDKLEYLSTGMKLEL